MHVKDKMIRSSNSIEHHKNFLKGWKEEQVAHLSLRYMKHILACGHFEADMDNYQAIDLMQREQ